MEGKWTELAEWARERNVDFTTRFKVQTSMTGSTYKVVITDLDRDFSVDARNKNKDAAKEKAAQFMLQNLWEEEGGGQEEKAEIVETPNTLEELHNHLLNPTVSPMPTFTKKAEMADAAAAALVTVEQPQAICQQLPGMTMASARFSFSESDIQEISIALKAVEMNWKGAAERFSVDDIRETMSLSRETGGQRVLAKVKMHVRDAGTGRIHHVKGYSWNEAAEAVAAIVCFVLNKESRGPVRSTALPPKTVLLPPVKSHLALAPATSEPRSMQQRLERAKQLLSNPNVSAINLLQEWAQSRGETLQSRFTIYEPQQSGPPHAPTFMQKMIDNQSGVEVTGIGRTSKQCRQDASALMFLEVVKMYEDALNQTTKQTVKFPSITGFH